MGLRIKGMYFSGASHRRKFQGISSVIYLQPGELDPWSQNKQLRNECSIDIMIAVVGKAATAVASKFTMYKLNYSTSVCQF